MGMGGGGGSSPTGPRLYDPLQTLPVTETPGRIALIPGGGFVVAYPSSREIRSYDNGGTQQSIFKISGQPLSVAVLNNGDLLVGNGTAGEVARHKPNGEKVGFLGIGPGEFLKPNDIAIDRSLHKVYVVDSKAHCIKIYRWDGLSLGAIGSQGSGDGQFEYPISAAVRPSTGDLFVADYINRRIVGFDRTGIHRTTFGAYGELEGELFRPAGVAVDGQGRILVTDVFQGWVQLFDSNGTYLGWAAEFGPEAGKLESPRDLVVDEANRLLVASTGSAKVEIYSNSAGGTSPLPTDPLPAVRPAGITFPEGDFDPALESSALFRVELAGTSISMLETDSIRLDGTMTALVVDRAPGTEVGAFLMTFNRIELATRLDAAGSSLLVTITGDLTSGETYAGTTRISELAAPVPTPPTSTSVNRRSGCGDPGGDRIPWSAFLVFSSVLVFIWLSRRTPAKGGVR
jgi:sugar lactone lactonase YvrE